MTNNIRDMMNDCINTLKTTLSTSTVIGAPFVMCGSTVVPISKISFALIAGGGEYSDKSVKPKTGDVFPCAGGSGAIVTITPLGFLVDAQGTTTLLKFNESDGERLMTLVNKITDSVFKKNETK